MNIFIVLIVVIVLIIVATVRFKVHPVFSLFIAALIAGLSLGLGPSKTIETIAEGFGNTLSSIGLIIAFGTVIGIFLEKTGGTQVIAEVLLNFFGIKRAPLAMNIAGFVISIPVFCDSGFIILSSLNKALSKRTGLSVLLFSVALATGLYAAHVFVPPTPGPLAAAAVLEADLALVMILGLLVAIPVSLVGYIWAMFIGRSADQTLKNGNESHNEKKDDLITAKVSSVAAFMPLVIPIILIAFKSIVNYPTNPLGKGIVFKVLDFLGNPVIALLIGTFLAFGLSSKFTLEEKNSWVVSALKEAGIIILITGAGGAFGNVLRTMDLADFIHLDSNTLYGGILIAFAIAALLKSAQGSSTVAIITTAAIMAPLLPSVGLDTYLGRGCAVLAIGAGAMTISHINDSYFWVVSQFSEMNVKTALRSFSVATFFQGLTGLFLVLLILSIFG